VALVDGLEWASAIARGGRYVLDIPERIPVMPPCFLGGRIVFRCGELTAVESPEWGSGLHDLDLTFGAPERLPKRSEAVPRPEAEPHDDILLLLDSQGDQAVSATEIGAGLNIDVPLVEGYLDELEPEGVVEVIRTFGGYSALITPRGRVRANRARRGRVVGGGESRARRPAAGLEARIDDASQHYFVAHEFSREKKDDLRKAIEEALVDSGLTPYYADAELRQGHILMDKILPKIRHTRFGIYDISNPKKANVFLELGAAIAMGKPYFILCEAGTDIPADLQGLDRIEYQSYSDLTDQLKVKIPKPSGGGS